MKNLLIIVRSKTLIASDYYFWKNNKNFKIKHYVHSIFMILS